MHLTDVPPGARGKPSPAQHMLRRAARLLGERPASLKRDPRQNARGGAALLARYARDTAGRLPADPGDW
jgi:hypothetical protein